MIIQEIINRARIILGEPTPTFWTDDELLKFCNEGITDLTLKLPVECLKELHYWYVNFAVKYTEYDEDYSIAISDDVLRVIAVIYPNGIPCKLIDFTAKRAILKNVFCKANDEEPYCYIFGGRIYFKPQPTDRVKIFAISKPSSTYQFSSTPPFEEPYQLLLILYVSAKAKMKDPDQVDSFNAGKELYALYINEITNLEKKFGGKYKIELGG
jgi:hypothetical protein